MRAFRLLQIKLVELSILDGPAIHGSSEYSALQRLPTVYGYGSLEGGLIAYGAREADIVVRTASFVDRILRGAKPADLPVQAPVKYQMILNLKTAEALGAYHSAEPACPCR